MLDEHHLTELHQCFRCELRFHWRTELEHHLATDHEQVHITWTVDVPEPRPAD